MLIDDPQENIVRSLDFLKLLNLGDGSGGGDFGCLLVVFVLTKVLVETYWNYDKNHCVKEYKLGKRVCSD